MKRQADPAAILQRLLDRYERRSDDRRIIERPTQAFPTPSARDSLVEGLNSAARSGAVKLEFDRDAPHLIARVTLQDAEKLYAFTGRKPRDVIARTASESIEEIALQTPVAQMLRSHFAEAWNEARREPSPCWPSWRYLPAHCSGSCRKEFCLVIPFGMAQRSTASAKSYRSILVAPLRRAISRATASNREILPTTPSVTRCNRVKVHGSWRALDSGRIFFSSMAWSSLVT